MGIHTKFGHCKKQYFGTFQKRKQNLGSSNDCDHQRSQKRETREWGWVINKYTKNKPVFW